jgi:hypothetical protein
MGTTISIIKEWPGKLSKIDAIRLIEQMSDRDDPFWENVVQDHYDEKTDSMPSIFHVFAALGITEAEYRQATGADGVVGWPGVEQEQSP